MNARCATTCAAFATGRWRLPLVAALACCVVGGCGSRSPRGAAPLKVERVIGEAGLSPGQFAYPRCLDNDGESLWVIDKQARVQRIDATTGGCLMGWRMPEYAVGKPTGVTCWTPRGGRETYVLVADTHYHRVMCYAVPREAVKGDVSAAMEPIARVGSFGRGEGEFIYPTDVAIAASVDGTRAERMYVSEYGGNDRVSVFVPADGDSRGGFAGAWTFAYSFGTFGDGAGEPVQFNRPQSMALDAGRGVLVVTDACNHRVGVLTAEGKLVRWISEARSVGAGPGQFNYPYGLALLADGTAMVAEFGNNRVQRIDLTSGASLGTFGVAGRGAGQLATPWTLTVMGRRVFVLDSGNDRIQVFEGPAPGLAGAAAAGRDAATSGGST